MIASFAVASAALSYGPGAAPCHITSGVTPDVMWQGASPGAYDKAADAEANAAIAQLGDKQCRAN